MHFHQISNGCPLSRKNLLQAPHKQHYRQQLQPFQAPFFGLAFHARARPPTLAPPSVSVIVCLARTFPVSSRDGAAVDVDKKWPAAAPDGRFPLPPPSAAFGGGPVRPSGRRPRFLHVQFGGGKRRGGIEERRHRRRREREKERGRRSLDFHPPRNNYGRRRLFRRVLRFGLDDRGDRGGGLLLQREFEGEYVGKGGKGREEGKQLPRTSKKKVLLPATAFLRCFAT